jgi:hypothetical protein
MSLLAGHCDVHSQGTDFYRTHIQTMTKVMRTHKDLRSIKGLNVHFHCFLNQYIHTGAYSGVCEFVDILMMVIVSAYQNPCLEKILKYNLGALDLGDEAGVIEWLHQIVWEAPHVLMYHKAFCMIVWIMNSCQLDKH